MLSLIYPFALLASGISANKMILATLPPVLFVGLRMIPAGLLLLAYCSWRDSRFWHHVWLYALPLVGVALFTTNINSILKAYALKNTLSSKVALIGSVDPFVTALYMYLFFGEKLTKNKWLGMVIGFLGFLVLIFYHGRGPTQFELLGFISLPELAAFSAVLISRIGWIKVQQILRTSSLNSMQVNGVTMLVGGTVALCMSYFGSEVVGSITVTPGLIGLFGWTIFVGNIAGYTLYANLLKKYSATFVSLAGFSVPFFVYLYGWLFIGEPLYMSFFVSAAITFMGLLLFYKDELEQSVTPVRK